MRQFSNESLGRVIDLKAAAKILNVSYSTILRMCRSGELPAYQTRRVWRTTDTACHEYINQQFEEQRLMLESTEVDHD